MADQLTQASVLSAFQSQFGKSARLFRAPARINIIGEHTDYNDGLVMPANTALYTWLAIAPREDKIVRMHTLNFEQAVELSLDNLQRNPHGGWQEYPKGVMHVLQEAGFDLRGADVLFAGDIPLGSGLSSSASLETVMAFAMLSCSAHEIDRRRLALMCRKAENEFVGVSCGIMDQYVISLCSKSHAMLLDCRSLHYELVALPANASLLIVNSGVHHQLREGSLNARQQECEQATALLTDWLREVVALRDVGLAQLDTHRSTLGDRLYRRSRHVVTENQRVRSALKAIVNDDMVTLGEIMTASHASLKNDFEVSCDELDALVDISVNCDGVFGSKMVGAGFGGCTVSLVDRKRVDHVIAEICRQYGKLLRRDPWCHVLEASDPVHELPVQ